MTPKKVTIRDIAAKAGVSAASVSMILNGKNLNRFSDETVQSVQKIAFSYHYQLKHPKAPTGTVMIICPSIMNPYYAAMIQSMEQEAIDRGLCTTIRTTYWYQEIERQLLEEALRSPGIIGVIFCMIPQQPDLARNASQKKPVVAVGDRLQDLGIDTVNVNNFHAGEMVGRHLLDLGHRNIAYISTALNADHSARVRRCDGLRSAYQAKYPTGKIRVYSADISSYAELNTTRIEHDVGYQLAQKCLSDFPEATALVAVNDMVAYGVIDGLYALNLQVPQDISVCGFDNIFPSQFSGVQLTTIEHSILERGRSAFRLLADRVANPEISIREGGITRVEYDSRLIIRKTTAPARPV